MGWEEQRAPHQHDQHGLAEIRLHDEKRNHRQQHRKRNGVGGHVRTFGGFAEQPGDENDESGFQKFRRLDVDAEQHEPAPRAFDLGAEIRS